MGRNIDAADMDPHVGSRDCDRVSRVQCGPQLGLLIHIGLEVHVDAVSQDETSASEDVEEINRIRLTANPVQAGPVLHTEGDVEETLTRCSCLIPHALIAREFHEQELWSIGPLIEGRQVDSRGVRPPNELHRLGPCEPPEPVASDHVGVRGPPFSLIAHDCIVQVGVQLSGSQVAPCMMQTPCVPYLVKYRLPSLSLVIELGKPVPPAAGRSIRSGHEEISRSKHQRVFVSSCLDFRLVRC